MWAFHVCPLIPRLLGVLVTAMLSAGCRAKPFVPQAEITTWSACYREMSVCRVKTHYGTKKVWLAAPRIRETEEGVLEIYGHFAVLAYAFERPVVDNLEFTGVEAELTTAQGGGGTRDRDGPRKAGALRATPWGFPEGTLGLSVTPYSLVLHESPPDFMVRFVEETQRPAESAVQRSDSTISTWSGIQKIVDAPDVRTTVWLAAPALTRDEDGVIDVGGEFLVVVFEFEWKPKVEEPSRIRLLMSSGAGQSWIQSDFDSPHYGGGAFRLSSKDAPSGAVGIAVVRGDPDEEPKWPGDFLIRFRK